MILITVFLNNALFKDKIKDFINFMNGIYLLYTQLHYHYHLYFCMALLLSLKFSFPLDSIPKESNVKSSKLQYLFSIHWIQYWHSRTIASTIVLKWQIQPLHLLTMLKLEDSEEYLFVPEEKELKLNISYYIVWN